MISEEQAAQITTAVVKNEDVTLCHVPTYVYEKDGKWYENIVSEIANRMIVNGKSETSFDGDTSITRAEFTAILVRALGLPADGECSFTDVNVEDWYYSAVGTAVEYKLVNGYTDGSFKPNINITRQEAMVMIQRAAEVAEYIGKSGSLSAFTDSDEVSSWAQSAVEFNVGSGLIMGSNGELRPKHNISRAETAAVILRLLQKAELVAVKSKN